MRYPSLTALGFALALGLPAQALAVCPPQAPISTLYISTLGDDSWSGLFSTWQGGTSGPFKTFAGARDTLYAYRLAGCLSTSQPVRVKVLAGEYYQSRTLTFSSQDSGTLAAPVVFEAATPNRRPIVTGGERLTGFTQEGLNWRLQRDEFKKANANHWNFEQLWVNGRRAIQARSPNRERLSDTVANRGFHAHLPYPGGQPRDSFKVDPSVMSLLAGLTTQQREDLQVTHMDFWTISRNFVTSLDFTNNFIKLAGSTWVTPQPCPESPACTNKSRLEFLNLPTALDAPGEFYLDRTTGVLLYRPFPGETIATSEVIASHINAPELLLLDGGAGWVQYLRFERINFRYTPYLLRHTWVDPSLDPDKKFTGGYNDSLGGFSLPAAITTRKAQSVTFDDVEVAHTGAAAVWLRGQSVFVTIQNSRLFDLGGGGIKVVEMNLGGGGVQPLSYRLAKPHSNFGSCVYAGGHHTISNNTIHSGGRSFYDTMGVYSVNSEQNLVSHNDVGDFFYDGIVLATARRPDLDYPDSYPGQFDSHDNVVQYNRVHLIGQDVLSDIGAIYVFSANENGVITQNRVSRVRHWDRPLFGQSGYAGNGIYLDGGSHSVSVTTNIIYDVESAGFMTNAGQGRLISNNVVAFTQEMAGIYNFGNTPNYPRASPLTLEKNIFFFDDYLNQGFFVFDAYSPPPAANRDHLGDVRKNVYYQLGGAALEGFTTAPPMGVFTFPSWQGQGADVGSIIADPLFVDPYSWNFDLQPGSPALGPAIGFQPITGTPGVEPTSPAFSSAGRLEAPGADFGGMFGFGDAGTVYGNPYYNNLPSCPPGYTETRMLGLLGLDNFASYCHRPRDDQRPLADFGGMFGVVNGTLVNNPVTSTPGCPAGYTQRTVLQSSVDNALYWCARDHVPGVTATWVWGGMYGYTYDALLQDHAPYPNPFNEFRLSSACPAGFNATQVYGTPNVDYSIVLCNDPTP